MPSLHDAYDGFCWWFGGWFVCGCFVCGCFACGCVVGDCFVWMLCVRDCCGWVCVVVLCGCVLCEFTVFADCFFDPFVLRMARRTVAAEVPTAATRTASRRARRSSRARSATGGSARPRRARGSSARSSPPRSRCIIVDICRTQKSGGHSSRTGTLKRKCPPTFHFVSVVSTVTSGSSRFITPRRCNCHAAVFVAAKVEMAYVPHQDGSRR